MAGRWSTSTFRQWLGLDVAYTTSSIWASSIPVPRWPSQLTATTTPSRWWVPRRLMRWPELDFSILDDVVWSLVTAFRVSSPCLHVGFLFSLLWLHRLERKKGRKGVLSSPEEVPTIFLAVLLPGDDVIRGGVWWRS
ncbi:hypothetical protein OIU78_021370 [Salix suchowensis]|nr:hypothetical protein OIU78_021370 [Salix suchowensis]